MCRKAKSNNHGNNEKEKNDYGLSVGMVIERTFYGRLYKLAVIKGPDGHQFKIENQVFDSLTAAARHVCRDETRPISGPKFWGLIVGKK
jgi:hypothetical protein